MLLGYCVLLCRHQGVQNGVPTSEEQHLLQQQQQPASLLPRTSAGSSSGTSDDGRHTNNVITSTFIRGAAAFIKVPASGSERFSLDSREQQQLELAASLSGDNGSASGVACRTVSLPSDAALAAALSLDGAESGAALAANGGDDLADAMRASVSDTAAAAAAGKLTGSVLRKHSAGAVMQRVLSLSKPKQRQQQQQQVVALSPAGIPAASPAGAADVTVKKDV
jgi:hypothetical protein